MLSKGQLKGHCLSCSFFTSIKGVVGYCAVLGIMLEKGSEDVAILDTIDTLRLVQDSDEQKILSPIIVQAFFSCPLYEDKQTKQQVL